jgi:succinyl-CoA synthetase beta subunit
MTKLAVTPFGRGLRAALPNLAFVQGIDGAMAVASQLLRTSEAQRAHEAAQREPVPSRRAQAVALLEEASSDMTEPRAKDLLRLYGFKTPAETFVETTGAASDRAREMAVPRYVVKAVVPGLQHKSEVAGVRLGLSGPAEVTDAFDDLRARLPELRGVIVAEQVEVGVELIASFETDHEIGPFVAFGLGGTGVELQSGLALVPPYCTPEEVRTAMAGTAVQQVLQGFRGSQAADVEAVVDAVCRLGVMAGELGDLVRTVEVNPLVTLQGRPGVLVLDALCVKTPTP